jgi:hypothetical protein
VEDGTEVEGVAGKRWRAGQVEGGSGRDRGGGRDGTEVEDGTGQRWRKRRWRSSGNVAFFPSSVLMYLGKSLCDSSRP